MRFYLFLLVFFSSTRVLFIIDRPNILADARPAREKHVRIAR